MVVGQKVKETVSGFEGIITARTEWFKGTPRVEITPTDVGVTGWTPPQWFDETRCEVIEV
jgi:hypothetical protein